MNQTKPSSENGNNHRAASVDVIEDDQQSTSAFYDPSNPLFAPPKQIDKAKHKTRKRKLIILTLVFVLLAGGGLALYQLLNVNRVNVKVQADARHDAQTAKSKSDSKGSENSLSADAVNITRAALGADSTTPTSSNTPSPTPTPSQPNSTSSVSVALPSLSATDYSPGTTNNGSTNTKTASQSATTVTPDPRSNGTNSAAQDFAQSRANTTQTILVEDSPPKFDGKTRPVTGTTQSPKQSKIAPTPGANIAPAVLPPFGTMLSVRTQGVIFSLRNNSYARLELIRDAIGKGWSLPKGTLLIGRTSGSENDRAYVNVIGYIDTRDNKLVKMTGEVLGSDGATGIPGKRVQVDRNRLGQTLRKVASSGVQVAGMMAGALGGRGTVVIDGAASRLMNPLTDEAGRMINGAQDKQAFVKVEAGRSAYVMVADLPKELRAVDAPGEDEPTRTSVSLTDRDVMELILFGAPNEIRAALPFMTDEQKRLALKAVPPEDEKR